MLLCAPGASFANDDRGDRAVAYAKVLRSAGMLAWGDGYGRAHGSQAVRALQIRLRTGGFRPGPVDGLYGPRTQAAVRSFQRRHDVKVDGIVGPQTRKPTPDPPPTPAPAPDPRPGPASSSGVSPWIAAALGALGAGLALGAFSLQASRRRGGRRRDGSVAPPSPSTDRRPSLGLVFAALLAVFAVGAAVGALFATNASEDGRASGDEPRAALSAERLGNP